MKYWKQLALLTLALTMLAGCAQQSQEQPEIRDVYVDRAALQEDEAEIVMEVEDEEVPLATAPALNDLLMPQASGTLVKENSRAKIDYSNTKDGYVMALFSGTTSTRIKVQIGGPTTTYTYDLPVGVWTTFPLSDGNGTYRVTVLENTNQKYYAQVVDVSVAVTLSDEFAPFLRPNQYVDYSAAPNTVAKAKELAGTETDPLKQVEKIYDFVVENLTYDQQLAATVKSGYLPVLDNVLSSKKGICFDYASLMTGMLRSVGVPCKLITGHVPLGNGQTGMHAWINVWTKDNGWVDGAIYFDGAAWQRMDPTFASNGNQSDEIMQYIGNGANYSVKYIY